MSAEPDWAALQPVFRDHLHAFRGHTFPAAEACAPCDQDADRLARKAVELGRELRTSTRANS